MRTGKAVLLIALAVCIAFAVVTVAEEADAASYDVDLNYTDASPVRVVQGLNPVHFNFTLEHTGDMLSEEVKVELLNEPPMWRHFFSANTQAGTVISTSTLDALLMRGEVASLTLTVTVPLNQLNGTYWMTVNTYPTKDPNQNESFIIGIIIPQVAAFEIQVWNPPPDATYKAIPPSMVTIRFALYNTGNGVDRFLIQGECSRSDEGWTLTFVSGVDEWGFTPNLTADPNKRNPHYIDVKVNIPANTRAGVTAQIVINATSMFNLSKQMPPAFAQVAAVQYYNFDAFIEGVDSKEGIPGETVTFQARIWNQGNGWDEFSIQSIWDDELNPGFIASTDPRTMSIDVDENGTFDYIVVVPMDASKKTYFFTVEIMSSSTELSSVTKSFAVEVGQYFSVSLSCDQPSQTMMLGGILDYEVMVTNTGNGLDSFIISTDDVPQGWVTYVQPPEVTLLQAKHATVKIRVIVPSRIEEAPAMEYSIVVVADSSRSDAEASLVIQVVVEQFHRIELMLRGEPLTDPDAPATQAGVYRPRPVMDLNNGTTTTFHLGVKNFGNGPDTVTLDWASDDSRLLVTLAPITVDLEGGVEHDFTVTVQVPIGIPPGIYEFWVYALSEDPSVDLRSVHLDFEVVPFYSNTDFEDLHYLDVSGDEYTFHFEASEAGAAVDRSSGEVGGMPGVDIISLDVSMDATTGAVTVEVLYTGTIVDDATTEHWVYFVEEGHRQAGVLLVPEEYHDGAFNWTFSDQDATLLYVFLMDGVGYMGATMEPVDVVVDGRRLVFTIPADGLLRNGLEPNSGFGLYAYAHVLETSTEKGWSTTLTWDTAGVGAAAAPDEFSNKPTQDGSPMGTFLAPLAMVVAALAAFALTGRTLLSK